ncbi:MAG: NAD(+) synthase [Lentisphaeria bacterium]|nr:NAD(+) synthase [Lentisphaeria bacterium]
MIAQFGYVRVGAAVPRVRPAAVRENLAAALECVGEAVARGCEVVVFPELGLTGYTCGDLFGQSLLLEAALESLGEFARATESHSCLFAVGLPVAHDGQLFNCAAAVCRGEVLGLVPKSYLPTYHEYYERRWFAPESSRLRNRIDLPTGTVPIGADLLFRVEGPRGLCIGIEICEDLWAPIPPSSALSLAGAQLLLNLSASNDLAGKDAYRLDLIRQQSARCLAAYAYCSAGVGESTTDLVFGGDTVIAENGTVLCRGERFGRDPSLTVADVDIAFLLHERRVNTSFGQGVERAAGGGGPGFREVAVPALRPAARVTLERRVEPRPFTPADPRLRHDRCQEIFAIQSTGLATRLAHTGLRDVLVGLSGGLDSTLALLVCIESFQRLGLDVAGIHALTMPGFGTTARTLGNVEKLCACLGIALETVDITDSCRRHLADIGHDGTTADVTFENAQARERTQVLMDKANLLHGMVIGTGDLSELALGWCTYNGDHMSMYGVNAGVPKTLVRYLIGYYAEDKADPDTRAVLEDVLATPISPELLPPDRHGDIAQKTESVLGPYELHDFFLYYLVRCGFPPAKVAMLAGHAFAGAYPAARVAACLRTFCRRFFAQQFKRSCLPDGPKVGTIALSPRGDWRMPSDAAVDEWLARAGAAPAPDEEPRPSPAARGPAASAAAADP